jgi:abequosyltransferase
MIANPLISITIPTYNRAEFLDRCLAAHIPVARAHNIQIFISDNASTDGTESVVKKRMTEYPWIRTLSRH